MSHLAVQSIVKRYGAMAAVDGVTLEIPQGQLLCFLGPSGCGKTTLLRIIAGLETPSSGEVVLNGKPITDVPAHRRGFGMVFQSLALFPHLTVAGNIAYSMRIAGRHPREREARVRELLDLIQLPDIGPRHINQLSGGQRQRVAIARALAQEPQVFLLDEPMSALDAKLREEMQVELRLLQRKLRITSILVTHDQKEAMTMADTVVVMNRGRVEQVGPPVEIYRRPASLFVAGFIGQSNLLRGELRDGTVLLDGCPLPGVATPTGLAPGPVTVAVRPENLRLHPFQQTGPHRIRARVNFIRDVGASVEVHLNGGELHMVSALTPRDWLDFREGDEVLAEIPPEACGVFAHG